MVQYCDNDSYMRNIDQIYSKCQKPFMEPQHLYVYTSSYDWFLEYEHFYNVDNIRK